MAPTVVERHEIGMLAIAWAFSMIVHLCCEPYSINGGGAM